MQEDQAMMTNVDKEMEILYNFKNDFSWSYKIQMIKICDNNSKNVRSIPDLSVLKFLHTQKVVKVIIYPRTQKCIFMDAYVIIFRVCTKRVVKDSRANKLT